MFFCCRRLVYSAFKILRGLWLYQARVPCSVWESLGAALTGLALTHTVARGTMQGLFTSGKPFMRTPKYEKQGPLFAGLRTIQQEILLLILLGVAIWQMSNIEHFDNLQWQIVDCYFVRASRALCCHLNHAAYQCRA